LREEALRPLMEAAIPELHAAFKITPENGAGEFEIEQIYEYDTMEQALEEVDALYAEVCYELPIPTGDVRLVIGTGLLESAAHVQRGEIDPFFAEQAEAAVAKAAAEQAKAHGTDLSALDALDAELAAAQAAGAAPAAASQVTDAEAQAAVAAEIA